MRSVDFCYFLQGFFELSEPNKALTAEQVQTIKNHLKLVFLYEIDPSYTDNKVVQAIFQNIHDGKEPLEGVKLNTPLPSRPNNDVIVKC
jgi:hypothetical protein